MLIPLRTDAPIYHAPWATVGVILLNVTLQIWSSATDYEYIDPLIIQYGTWMPHQWLTSAFLHAGWLHLIGNMVFLWVFGLVVEGKVGWWRFLALYAAIAMASGLLEQTIMLGADGGSLGASGVIFGLLAIAMVWAPDNEIDCLLLLYGIRYIELPIKVFACIYLGLQFIEAAVGGFGISSAVLHLIGAGAGLPIGILMLRRGWVDCEGWDWFTRHNRHRLPPQAPSKRIPPSTIAAPPPDQAALDSEYRSSFLELVQAGSTDAALQVWRGNGGERWGAPIPARERLVGQLVKAGRFAEAAPFIDGIRGEDPGHPAIGLLLAQIRLKERRPAAALAILEAVQPRLAAGRQRELHDQLRARCAALQAEGVLEIAT